MFTHCSVAVCIQALRAIDPISLNMARLSECSDTHVLNLLFILTGMKPTMKLHQLGCKTKDDFRELCKTNYMVRAKDTDGLSVVVQHTAPLRALLCRVRAFL